MSINWIHIIYWVPSAMSIGIHMILFFFSLLFSCFLSYLPTWWFQRRIPSGPGPAITVKWIASSFSLQLHCLYYRCLGRGNCRCWQCRQVVSTANLECYNSNSNSKWQQKHSLQLLLQKEAFPVPLGTHQRTKCRNEFFELYC